MAHAIFFMLNTTDEFFFFILLLFHHVYGVIPKRLNVICYAAINHIDCSFVDYLLEVIKIKLLGS